MKDITWYRDNGTEPDAIYLYDPNKHFLAYRIDGTEFGDKVTSICVAYNAWKGDLTFTLPQNMPGKKWYRVADTAGWMENQGNGKDPGQEELMADNGYSVKARSVLLLIER